MATDASNQDTDPSAEGEVFYVPPPEQEPRGFDRRQAVDPNFSGPDRRKANRRKPIERRGQNPGYELKSRAETNFPEAFIPVSKEFYEDGTLLLEATFKDGRQDGTTTFYYESGAPRFVSMYEEGGLVHRKHYDDMGQLISKVTGVNHGNQR